MKNFFLTLSLVVAAALAAYGSFYLANSDRELTQAARQGDAMAWLRTEFKLNDAQFAAIKQLHDDYGRVCGEHCAAIMAARSNGAPAAEVAALERTCVDAMTQHFQRVAALMPEDQGPRYLATVLPRVAGYNHNEAPTVQVGR